VTYGEGMENRKFEFLGKLYELAGGSWNVDVRQETLRSDLDWERDVFYEVAEYLRNQGLIDYPTMTMIRLTEEGADEWEEHNSSEAT